MRFFLPIYLLILFGVTSALALLPPKIITPPNQTNPAIPPLSAPVTIGSWNMEWFPIHNPHNPNPRYTKTKIDGVKKILSAQNPTILFACEIRSLTDLQQLQLHYPYLACTDFSRSDKDNQQLPNQGLAMLSRYPWKEIWALDFSSLPSSPNHPSRGILAAEFVLPNQQSLTIYGVHLKSNHGNPKSNQTKRESAIEYLEWDWQRRGLDPKRDHIIILGDFNTSIYDPIFTSEKTLRRLFSLGFTDSAEGLTEDQRITIPANNQGYPDNDFDHILISPSLRSQLNTRPPWVKIIPVSFSISDHYPLFLNATPWFTANHSSQK